MKNSFLAFALLLSIPVVLISYERKLSINVVNKNGQTLYAVDPFKKQLSPEENKRLKFAGATFAANATDFGRTHFGFLVPLMHSMLQIQYLNKCQGDLALTQDCIESRKNLEFIKQLPAEALKFEKQALQVSMKLRKDLELPEGAHVQVVLSYDAPEVMIAPEGGSVDASSAAPAESAPTE